MVGIELLKYFFSKSARLRKTTEYPDDGPIGNEITAELYFSNVHTLGGNGLLLGSAEYGLTPSMESLVPLGSVSPTAQQRFLF